MRFRVEQAVSDPVNFRIKFVFSFSRLDATIDDGTLGRLVNDEDKKPNAVVKVLMSVLISASSLLKSWNQAWKSDITTTRG